MKPKIMPGSVYCHAAVIKELSKQEQLIRELRSAALHYSVCGFRNSIDCSVCGMAEVLLNEIDGRY